MNLNPYLDETGVSRCFQSAIPSATRVKPCMLGVDEAGRGPVLGPMVYGICYCPLDDNDRLTSMKFADSKTLSEEAREGLFEEMNGAVAGEILGWMIDVISPNTISNNMLRRSKYNLNAISHDSAIGLIRKALTDGVNVKEVYVDTVGDPGKYQAKLTDLFPGIKVTVAKKADSTFPIVSAASICAKVARDRILKQWKFVEKMDVDQGSWGSGYPGDPKTKKFLNEQLDNVFGYPQLVRFSWSTASKILDDKAVKVDWEEDADDNSASTTPSVLSYFRRTPTKPSKGDVTKNHQFFTDRCLNSVNSF